MLMGTPFVVEYFRKRLQQFLQTCLKYVTAKYLHYIYQKIVLYKLQYYRADQMCNFEF